MSELQRICDEARAAGERGEVEAAILGYRQVLAGLPNGTAPTLLAQLVYEIALLYRRARCHDQALSLAEKAASLDGLHRDADELARTLAETAGRRPVEAEVGAYLDRFFGNDPNAMSYIA